MSSDNIFHEKERVILYGAGKDAISALNLIDRNNVICFCDNKKAEEGSLQNIPIKSFDDIMQNYHDELFVITASVAKSVYEITRQLAESGVRYTLLDHYLLEEIRNLGGRYNLLNTRKNFEYTRDNEYIISRDKGKEAGTLGSYFWQDLWAAKHIFEHKPTIHFDIGSRIDGFIAHLLSFGQKVKQVDIRPNETGIDGWEFVQCDATNMDGIPDESIDSLSALCSLEHFGLGRYGDEIDPDACFKCFKAIQKKLTKGGYAYISVPISGDEHLEYNAHRVFHPLTIVREFDTLDLIEFSAAEGELFYKNVELHRFDDYKRKGGRLFGLFMLRKTDI